MTKILPFFLLFGMLSFNLKAFHIVGGEIELVHVEGFTYNLNLIQYFDAAQADNPAPDQSVTVYIYENGTNAKVDEYLLPLQFIQTVPYTTPDCAIGQLQTLRPYYSRQVTLDPDKYSNPAGYYAVWERCCRNASVVNLNNATGTNVGMTYVLEFPAIMKNGDPFVNSTPQLFPPLSDYACINQLYYTSFAGIDVDGDSLVYSLKTPLNSSSSDPVPTPKAKPHFPVIFANGFDRDNMVPGNPSLQISPKGFLTVEPEFTGLFVFSVLVEEFREGIKIGQVTRDFQMLVIDGCDPPAPPDAHVRLPGEDEFYNEVDVIRFTVADEKCFEFLVTDDVGDLVTFRAEGVNFEQRVEDIFEFNQSFINQDRDTLRVEVCIPDCPYVRDEPFIIDLLAADNACPLPQIDTVRLTIFVEPPPNDAPQFQTATKTRIISLPEGQVYTEKFIGRDGDGDFLVATIEPNGFELDEYGMSLNLTKNLAGENEVEFKWDARCLTYNFYEQSNFELSLILEDLDVCSQLVADTILYDLTVDLPPNSDPVISTGLGDSPAFSRIGSKLEFNVNVKDADNDRINLRAFAPDFNMQDLGLVFDDVTGVGEINSLFSWQLDCDVLDIVKPETYNIYFVADDEDECKFPNTDTLKVVVNVIVPYNNKPEFDLYPDYELTVNEPFSLDIMASDRDNDFISVDLLEGVAVPPSPSFSFERVSGEGQVTSTLEWTPECSLLDDGFAPKKYNVFFLVWDGRCPIQKYDTMSIIFEIKELEVDYDTFLPANAFTPNGDALNNTFKLTNLPIPEQNLPPDNCEDQFLSIVIVDRKGKTVFESDDRNFEWTGNGMPASTYYYSIRYLHTDYRGTISILY